MATDRFQEIERRYEELNRELSSPEVASDPSRLRDLGKQHAELEGIVRTHRAVEEAERQAAEWREMAKERRTPRSRPSSSPRPRRRIAARPSSARSSRR